MSELHVFGPIAHGADRSMFRADLELYGINHFRPSYVGLVFFNDPEADPDSEMAACARLVAQELRPDPGQLADEHVDLWSLAT